MAAGEVSVYVAARFQHKARAAALARELRAEGARITSVWHDDPNDVTDQDVSFQERARRAQQDLDGVLISDGVVLLNPVEDARLGTGGCHVETGYALALWKPVVVVGALSNVFHYLPAVLLAPTARTAMASMRALVELQQARLLAARRG